MRLALALAIALCGVAAAQPKSDDVQKAAALYDRGKRHFDIAEYSAAISVWKEAYLLSSEPLLLFNIAQAHRLAGDCAQANRFYLNYKRIQPKPPNQGELDSAMAKCAGVAPATGDTTPATSIAPDPLPPVPEPKDPIPPKIEASLPTPSNPPEQDTIETEPGRIYRLTGIAVASAGGVATILSVVFAFQANSKANEIEGQRPGTEWDDNLAGIESDGQTAQTRARVLGVIGAVAVVGGGALWWYGRSKASVRVDVAITPQHSQVGLSCAF